MSNVLKLDEQINGAFIPAFYCEDRFLILYGGAGSGKSFFAAQKIILRCLMESGHRFVALRKVGRTVLTSIWQQIFDVIECWGLKSHFVHSVSERTITCVHTGSKIIFMGLDDPEKIKSIAGITGFWVEECTELSPEDLRQLNTRLRGMTDNYKQIILSFNPISVTHWLKRDFFDTRVDNCTIVKTTYRDNAFLDTEYCNELENYKNTNPIYYEVYCLGDWGVFEGSIFPPFIMEGSFPDPKKYLYSKTFYGIDFGWTAPTALVQCDFINRELYITELIYEKELTNTELINKMNVLCLKRGYHFWCDSAEPGRIKEIRRAGYNAVAVNKRQGSVQSGIAFLQGIKKHTRASNINLNREVNSYRWKLDVNGDPTCKPEDDNDHALSALRYAVVSEIWCAFKPLHLKKNMLI